MTKHTKNRVSLLAALILHTAIAEAIGQTCLINWDDVHQRIDGFGASCAFSGRTWSSNTADNFFTTNFVNGINGIGLSLLRNQIQPGGFVDGSELSLMKLAQARGVRIWSAPWSPQASFKNNNNTVGGNYLGNGANATNLAYAAQLANYVVTNQTLNGVNIYAVSIQNEPDASVGYTSCYWTAQQIHDFATNLYNAFQASNVTTKVMLPEDESWQTNLYITTLSDPNAAAGVGIIACHNYVGNNLIGDQNPPAALPGYGKALWETEVATLSSSTPPVTDFFDPSITNAMYWATRIHLFMTVAQVNAWHYWYLITGTSPSDNEGLEGTGDVPSKRMFAVGQFSRFVRPDYYRIGATTDTNIFMVSAYKDSVSPAFAIVAINTNTFPVNETFNLTNFDTTAVTPWLTTSNFSLQSTDAVPVSGGSFAYEMPAMSVVTFVGSTNATPANTPPVLLPVANQITDVGVTLTVTNQATDSDLPPQTLTFDVVGTVPANSTLDGTSGVFIWRPLVSQADTTNRITVEVTDNGVPNLSASNSFTVAVNPLVHPTVSSIAASGGQVSLLINGPAGPDYTLLTSTNLMNWQILLTTNSPALPLVLVDTNLSDRTRFYRIQLGP